MRCVDRGERDSESVDDGEMVNQEEDEHLGNEGLHRCHDHELASVDSSKGIQFHTYPVHRAILSVRISRV